MQTKGKEFRSSFDQAFRSADRDECAQTDYELAQRKVELLERKSKVWRTFIGRETVATIIGGMLLLVLAGSLIIAMFIGTEISEIVTNSFLVLLGYFFGQSTARVSQTDR